MFCYCLYILFCNVGIQYPLKYISDCRSFIKTLNPNYGNANISINNTEAYITCINDSTLRGSQNVTCQHNGSWNPQFPKCLVNCPALPDRPVVLSKETITYVQVYLCCLYFL